MVCSSCADAGPAPWTLTPIARDYRFPARDAKGAVLPEGVVVSAADLDRGRLDYLHFCASCHGLEGDGQGRSAGGPGPPARNFRTAQFKFAAVRSGELPNDDDLVRLVRDGLHDTAMPAWGLPEERIVPMVHFLKTFPAPTCDAADRGAEACAREAAEHPRGAPTRWQAVRTTGPRRGEPVPTGEPVRPTEDPWAGRDAAAALRRGERVYHLSAQCSTCHPSYLSKDGRARTAADEGELAPDLRGRPERAVVLAADRNPYGVDIRPPDLRRDPLRSIRPGREKEDLYRVIAAGVGGVMPAWVDALPQEDLWALVHYVGALTAAAPGVAAPPSSELPR